MAYSGKQKIHVIHWYDYVIDHLFIVQSFTLDKINGKIRYMLGPEDL